MEATVDMTRTQELIELEERYGAHNYHPLDVVIDRAQGVWVYDVEGNRYLDCLASYSAVNQGHCHPKILQAMVEQARRVTLTSRAFRNDQLPLLYKELYDLTGYEMALPMNSGAENPAFFVHFTEKVAEFLCSRDYVAEGSGFELSVRFHPAL